MSRAPFRIPRELLIRGKRWLVVQAHELGDDPHDARARMMLNNGPLLGVSYPPGHPHIKREIHLNVGHPENRQERKLAQTFLHELLHACSSQNACSMKVEEEFIQDIERPLFRVLEQLDWRKP